MPPLVFLIAAYHQVQARRRELSMPPLKSIYDITSSPQEIHDQIREKFIKSEPVDVPYFLVKVNNDFSNAEIVGHNGRNRALLAVEFRFDKIPVMLRILDFDNAISKLAIDANKERIIELLSLPETLP
jgi:hypothetical protein